MTQLTTAALPAFLQLREEFRAVVYDDLQPEKELIEGDEVKGTLTYGYGTITRPDGSPLQIGDTISHQEALDRLNQYIREEIEPAIENIIHVPITGEQADALGSLIYNFGAPAVSSWRLIRRINSNEPADNIAIEWLTDTYTSKGEPLLGLYRRRIMEVLMFFGLDWRAGAAVSWGNSIMEVLEEMGWDGTTPKPGPVHDSELFEDEGANEVTREKGSDPTPETPMTLDDAQFLNAEAVGYDGTYADFMAHRTVVTQRNAIEAPKVDAKKPPKPMEDSKTHRGLSKKDSGKEGVQMGAVLTGAATTMGTVRELTRDTAATAESASPLIGGFTANHLILVGLFIGVPLLLWGAWRMMRGEMIAREGRQEGTQLKV